MCLLYELHGLINKNNLSWLHEGVIYLAELINLDHTDTIPIRLYLNTRSTDVSLVKVDMRKPGLTGLVLIVNAVVCGRKEMGQIVCEFAFASAKNQGSQKTFFLVSGNSVVVSQLCNNRESECNDVSRCWCAYAKSHS